MRSSHCARSSRSEGYVSERIVIDATFVLHLLDAAQEKVESAGGVLAQGAVGVEVSLGVLLERLGAFRAGAEHDFPLGSVERIDLRIGRIEAGRQLQLVRLGPRKPAQEELDVFAGSQRVDGEVGAGAKVLAQRRTPNCHAIGPAALGIGHFVIGKEGFLADVFVREILLPAVLATQRDLPLVQ